MVNSNEQLKGPGYQQAHKRRTENPKHEPDASERVRHGEQTRPGRAFYQVRERPKVSAKEEINCITNKITCEITDRTKKGLRTKGRKIIEQNLFYFSLPYYYSFSCSLSISTPLFQVDQYI